MKKYLTGILAVALALGASAFTAPHHQLKADQQLYWVAANGTDDGLRSDVSESSLRGCSTGSNICAQGYDNPEHTGAPIETLFKPQP